MPDLRFGFPAGGLPEGWVWVQPPGVVCLGVPCYRVRASGTLDRLARHSLTRAPTCGAGMPTFLLPAGPQRVVSADDSLSGFRQDAVPIRGEQVACGLRPRALKPRQDVDHVVTVQAVEDEVGRVQFG